MRVISGDICDQDRPSWAALSWAARTGPAGFMRLLARFGSARAVIEADRKALTAPSLKLTEMQIDSIVVGARDLLDSVEEQISALGDDGIRVICSFEEGYPPALLDAANPPPVICVRGELTNGLALAIVGTREPTREGARVAREVAEACARRGITVVSGLARGIDTAAHRGALDGEGRTLAVLGSGIRRIHPRRNIRLAGQIAANGAIISALPPDASPTGARLMARNRLTSALAGGVLAVESTNSGGTLQTVSDARKQGRLVFACDWQASRPQAEGTRSILAEGGEPILGADAIDLIEYMLANHEHRPDQQSLL